MRMDSTFDAHDDTYHDLTPHQQLKERYRNDARDQSHSRPSSRPPVRRQTSTHSSSTSLSSASSWRWKDLHRTPSPAPLALPQPSEARGSFAPTSPVFSSLRAFVHPARPSRRFRLPHPWSSSSSSSRQGAPRGSGALDDADDSDATSAAGASPPSSPESRFASIPSICRTTSDSEPDDDDPHTTRPLTERWAPLARTPLHRIQRTHSSSSSAPAVTSPKPSKLAPELAEAERASRLRTSCRCSMCGRSGANFPTSPQSGESWCSRECRVAARERRRAQAAAAHV